MKCFVRFFLGYFLVEKNIMKWALKWMKKVGINIPEGPASRGFLGSLYISGPDVSLGYCGNNKISRG